MPDTGEETDLRRRAERLDEGIDLIRTLWDGGTSYHGQHYRYRTGRLDLTSAARPVQERIPIWVVGVWPRPKSLRRALRCDGIIPQYQLDGGRDPGPGDARALRGWLDDHGAGPGLRPRRRRRDPGGRPGRSRSRWSAPWADAGCTWWLETRWEMPHDSSDRMGQVARAAGRRAARSRLTG